MDQSEDGYALTLEQVGQQLGLTRERARQIQQLALIKVRCALAIEEVLGGAAMPVLESLRGRPVRAFKSALRKAKAPPAKVTASKPEAPSEPATATTPRPKRRIWVRRKIPGLPQVKESRHPGPPGHTAILVSQGTTKLDGGDAAALDNGRIAPPQPS